MIVAETADRYRFVTQPDHADLAGTFAARWGNGGFERIEPFPPLVLAAAVHDAGWTGYDRRPHLDEDGRPVDFRDVPAEAWIDLYDDGIEWAVELDRYAGLLVSMHGAGLRKRRYGLSPGWPATPAAFAAFVERQEALQSRLLDDLLAGGRPDELGPADADLLDALHESGRAPDGCRATLWQHYKLLQAWDALSLAFCTTVSPPGYRTIGDVPAGPAAGDGQLSIEPVGDDEYEVDPYPFDTDPLVTSVPSRSVRKDAFEDAGALARAFYAARRERVSIALRAGGR